MIDASFNTKIRNMSANSLTLSFLPSRYRSKRLASGEEMEIEGDLRAQMCNDLRGLKAFSRALVRGDLALVKTPAVHCYDETMDVTNVITVDNASVLGAVPSWGNYSSSI